MADKDFCTGQFLISSHVKRQNAQYCFGLLTTTVAIFLVLLDIPSLA